MSYKVLVVVVVVVVRGLGVEFHFDRIWGIERGRILVDNIEESLEMDGGFI